MIDCGLIAQALDSYDADAHLTEIDSAEAQRGELIDRFPRDAWAEMSLDRYALGQTDHRENFCRWIEFVATDMGSIKGGSARKHHIYFQSGQGEWWFEKDRYSSVDEAWREVRNGFIRAIALADTGEWEAIDGIGALHGGPAQLAKTLHLYFPNEILPICSSTHLTHFLARLGEAPSQYRNLGAWCET